jgi:hypothetical protein
MRKFALAAAIAVACLATAGCQQLQAVVSGAQTVYAKVQAYYQSAAKTVYAARGGYDIALAAAVQFKETQCPSVSSHSFCATLIPQLRQADAKAKVAFDEAENFVRANPTLDASALINAAKQAALDFAQIETANGVAASN